MTELFRVPAGIESENVVYSRAFEASETGCRICGEPVTDLQPDPTPRRYCSKAHKHYAARVRRGERCPVAGVTGAPGTCAYCGATLESRPRWNSTCTRRVCRTAYRRRGFAAFKRRCKWPLPLAWLGPKIKRAADDPQLPQLALALALKGLLVVYVRGDGTIGDVGRPKETAPPRVHVPPRDLTNEGADEARAGRSTT